MSMTADNTLPTATPVQSGETGFDALLESLAQADGAAAQTLPADADAVSAMPVNVQVGTDAQVEAQAGEVAPQAIENANVQAAEAQGDSQKAATPPAATFELLQSMAMDLATAKPATDAADEQTVKTVAKKPQHDETTDAQQQTDATLQNNLTGVAVQQAVEAVSVLPVTLPVEAIAANATASQQTSAAPILPAQSDVNATEQTQATQSADTAAIVQNAAVTVPATQDAPLVNAARRKRRRSIARVSSMRDMATSVGVFLWERLKSLLHGQYDQPNVKAYASTPGENERSSVWSAAGPDPVTRV